MISLTPDILVTESLCTADSQTKNLGLWRLKSRVSFLESLVRAGGNRCESRRLRSDTPTLQIPSLRILEESKRGVSKRGVGEQSITHINKYQHKVWFLANIG